MTTGEMDPMVANMLIRQCMVLLSRHQDKKHRQKAEYLIPVLGHTAITESNMHRIITLSANAS